MIINGVLNIAENGKMRPLSAEELTELCVNLFKCLKEERIILVRGENDVYDILDDVLDEEYNDLKLDER